MRGTTDEGLALGTHYRVGLSPGLEGEIAIPCESLLLLTEWYSVTLDHQVSASGVTLTAELNGLKCVVGWDPITTRIVTKSAPEMSVEFVEWCRHAHMNLVNVHCNLAALVIDDFAKRRLLAAATAMRPSTPNSAIELEAVAIGSLCETHGFDRLWCNTHPASAMDDVNTAEVTLVYERYLGELEEGTAELEKAIATLIGYRVRLTWRKPTTSTTHHALKLANAREVWKSAK